MIFLRVMRVKRTSEDAHLPERATEGSVGYDLFAAVDAIVPPQGKELISTHLQLELPSGCYGRIAPRSGLAAKHFIDVGAGVIDPDYRGEIKVLLFNHSHESFEVKKGAKIAQLILECYKIASVEEVQELQETERGEGGFGSTDAK